MPKKKGDYEAELEKPDHVPGEYLEDVPLGADEEPADADTSEEPVNDTVEEPA